MGFMALDRISEELGMNFDENICACFAARGERVILAKPQTYMNRSGSAVADMLKRFSLTPEDMAVLHDDIDIPLGKIKEKRAGGSAGHNGIGSIMDALGTGEFMRIRMGVGRPPEGESPADYVLRPFEASEEELVGGLLDESCNRAINFV